jgi:AcrR family transcriptional regulator
MSLYNHVRDKEDILDSICQEVLAEFETPDEADWTEALRAGAREYRRLLLAHPRVVTLMTERKAPFTNPDSLRAYEFALDVFRRAGLSVEDALKAFHVMGGYIVGFVTMETGLGVGAPPDDEAHAEAHHQMERTVASADLPRLQEAFPYLMDCDFQDQFEYGLDLIVEGLCAKSAARS